MLATLEAFKAQFRRESDSGEPGRAALGAVAATASRPVHMNNAGLAPLPRAVREGVARFLTEEGSMGAHGVRAAWGAFESARRAIARFVDASPREVAFTAGCAESLSAVGLGLAASGALGNDDEILSFEGEYPSNAYCWNEIARRTGSRFVRVARFEPETLMAAVTAHTRIVTFSSVQSFTGDVVPVEPLVRACRERFGAPEEGGPWIVVDAIQGIGVVSFSFAAAGVDALAFASHKWLCSTPGTGVLVVREPLLARLSPPVLGAMSYGTPDDAFDPGRALRPDAKRFEGTTANLVGAVALERAISVLEGAGARRVEAEALRLKAALVRGLASRGALFEGANAFREGGSPIVTFTLGTPERDAEAHAALDLARVSHVHRFGRLRLSPHAFNDDADIARTLAALDFPRSPVPALLPKPGGRTDCET